MPAARPLPATLAALLLAGCTSLPVGAPLPARQQVSDFSLSARFTLRATSPGEPAQSASGRLEWVHVGESDTVLITNPLGAGLAELRNHPGHAELRTGDGQSFTAPDPDTLLVEALGQPLPATRLPAWLLGRPYRQGTLRTDEAGRPAQLNEDGWQIDYTYPDRHPDTLPHRLMLIRPGDIDLRLRIERWQRPPSPPDDPR